MAERDGGARNDAQRSVSAPPPGPEHRAQCRAGWTRHILNGVDALPPVLGERALAALPADAVQKLRASVAIHWLPFDVHMAILRALLASLGRRAYEQLCRQQILSSLQNPIFFAKPARAALQLYDASPFAMFRAIPPSLRYIFRDAGRLRIEVAPGGRQLHAYYEDFPPQFSDGDTWALIWAATFQAVADYALENSPVQAHFRLARHEPERGYFEWHAETSER